MFVAYCHPFNLWSSVGGESGVKLSLIVDFIFRAIVILAMFALVFFTLTWLHDGLDLSRRVACNGGTVEAMFTGCKVIKNDRSEVVWSTRSLDRPY
jgi:hypothetical protein